ncbi:MAG: diguanylate cyclase [Chromatiales bacterium]|jgi:diguanylate cyclase (GGDEF)-like protein
MTFPDSALNDLARCDTEHAVQLADRVWWVGHRLANDAFQCHVYLIEQGRSSVLIDPGSRLTFDHTLRKVEEVVPFADIRYFVCHHQDPDIAAALPFIDELVGRDDAVIVTHWRARALLKHYGLRLPFWLIDEHDWRLELEDRELSFVFTPYAHFPGAFCTFDQRSGIMFSSDLFGGFTEEFSLLAGDESYFECIRPFHEHYMPSPDILDYAIAAIEQYPVRMIAPQHGSIIPEPLVGPICARLRHLDCGIYLYARGDTDVARLSRLNRSLREIRETMTRYREFSDIAIHLHRLVSRTLPVREIRYFARSDGGAVIGFGPADGYAGRREQPPVAVAAVLGMDRGRWLSGSRETGGPMAAGYRLAPTDSGSALIIPLFSAEAGVAEGVAVMELQSGAPISPESEEIIEQLTGPLQVALEREVLHEQIDRQRRAAYERSIRDPLTGLFNRFYMADVVERMCSLHDRDPTQAVGAILVDIDHFKDVNDRWGHLRGDEALRHLAGILSQNIRSTDVAVRLGGEEFAIFKPGADGASLQAVAERMRAAVENAPLRAETDSPLQLTISAGVAIRGAREPLEDLIGRTDGALYRAKRAGRNRVCMAEMPASRGGEGRQQGEPDAASPGPGADDRRAD